MKENAASAPKKGPDRTIRTVVDQDGKQWWLGEDVCAAFGIENPEQEIKLSGNEQARLNTRRTVKPEPGNASSGETYNITVVAEMIGSTAIALNKYLSKRNIQYYKDGRWVLYPDYEGKGYTEEASIALEDRVKSYMRWTEAGVKMIKACWAGK